jgi:hypothetical protein
MIFRLVCAHGYSCFTLANIATCHEGAGEGSVKSGASGIVACRYDAEEIARGVPYRSSTWLGRITPLSAIIRRAVRFCLARARLVEMVRSREFGMLRDWPRECCAWVSSHPKNLSQIFIQSTRALALYTTSEQSTGLRLHIASKDQLILVASADWAGLPA